MPKVVGLETKSLLHTALHSRLLGAQCKLARFHVPWAYEPSFLSMTQRAAASHAPMSGTVKKGHLAPIKEGWRQASYPEVEIWCLLGCEKFIFLDYKLASLEQR